MRAAANRQKHLSSETASSHDPLLSEQQEDFKCTYHSENPSPEKSYFHPKISHKNEEILEFQAGATTLDGTQGVR